MITQLLGATRYDVPLDYPAGHNDVSRVFF